jgi:NAD(P)-dependent dehydrogenase (short-subunit alcohol dehydrogenase family)
MARSAAAEWGVHGIRVNVSHMARLYFWHQILLMCDRAYRYLDAVARLHPDRNDC